MHSVKSVIRSAAIISAIALLSLATACSKPAEKPKTAAAEAAVQQGTPTSGTKLGDLSGLRNIAVDVAGIVDKNDLPAAKKRIKDLELSWDEAEAGIKPRAASDWHLLDKAIDRALAALRASTPNQAECKTAMDDLLKTFDTLQGKQ
jgi:hypothetical protein